MINVRETRSTNHNVDRYRIAEKTECDTPKRSGNKESWGKEQKEKNKKKNELERLNAMNTRTCSTHSL